MNKQAPCGEDIPSITELLLRKSVELTKRPDDEEDQRTLERLKKLLADTREMVAQAERLLASLRNPKDAYGS